MKKFEKWQRLDGGGHWRYPLAYNFGEGGLRNLQSEFGGRKCWLQHHFPELWCWLELNVPHYEWDVGFRGWCDAIDLLIVYNVRSQFEAAWEDRIE